MSDPLAQALPLWGLQSYAATLVAARENLVYRIEAPQPLALRLHRRGLRSKAQLLSELEWMAALAQRGLSVARPHPALDGALCHEVGGQIVDVLGWLDGVPMCLGGTLNPLVDGVPAYHALGQAMAQLHLKSDDWAPPPHFDRPSWDAQGLLGEDPLWGRFWENPLLTPAQSALLIQARHHAIARLSALHGADYGLIHADLVQENVLIGPGGPHLIDFDDGGFGYRLFDIATVLNFILREAKPAPLQDAFVQGYLATRPIDLSALPLFQALRAFSYVGWIVPRLSEDGAQARQDRFVTLACQMAEQVLAG
jgi:Ser/Thr protein kinase RdoA (MazF antagonist)